MQADLKRASFNSSRVHRSPGWVRVYSYEACIIRTTTLAEQVYRQLFDDIVSGRRGSGVPLREIELANEMKVSRTPIREAIRQLASTGLVEVKPNCGAIVRELDEQQVIEAYQVREALEVTSVRLACGRLTPEDISELDQMFAEASQAEGLKRRELCNELDIKFHRLIALRAGNRLLMEELDRLHDLMSLLRAWSTMRPEYLELAFKEHQQIWKALKRNDSEKACRAMSDHIRVAGQRNADYVRTNPEMRTGV